MKVFLFNDAINTSDSHLGKKTCLIIAKSPNLLLQIGQNKY